MEWVKKPVQVKKFESTSRKSENMFRQTRKLAAIQNK